MKLARLFLQIACINMLSFHIIEAQYMKTRHTEEFINTIGVTTHWSYNDTPYGAQFDTVFSRLKESGIRLIRDGVRLNEMNAAGIINSSYACSGGPIP